MHYPTHTLPTSRERRESFPATQGTHEAFTVLQELDTRVVPCASEDIEVMSVVHSTVVSLTTKHGRLGRYCELSESVDLHYSFRLSASSDEQVVSIHLIAAAAVFKLV
jgi:hypothetical protein